MRQLVPVELPTGTRKRVTIPAFAPLGGYAAWNVRLLDDRGRVLVERTQLQPKTQVPRHGFFMGAISRTFAGTPALPSPTARRPNPAPTVARLSAEQAPDHPILLEGFNALYLNSERIADLRPPQAAAIEAWVRSGGHLLLGVEQPGDVNNAPWVRNLIPATLAGLTSVKLSGELQRALPTNLTNLAPDVTFDTAELPVALATPKRGAVVRLSAGGVPLMITGAAGHGQVTLLAFNPEREPFLSWRHRTWFWLQAAKVPHDLITDDLRPNSFQLTTDGLFGALVDSRQVNKLPFGWLVVLLLAYLVIIGPGDHLLLRKLGRPMLTWITFPLYVVGFSLLVYLIGYALRAGENEWNEIHVVDVVPDGSNALLRGRTFASIYSSSNRRYGLRADTNAIASTLRPEARPFGGSKAGLDQIRTRHEGNSFQAELTVPVWTTLLCANDWMESSTPPVTASTTGGSDASIVIHNRLKQPLKRVFVLRENQLIELPVVPGNATRTNALPRNGTNVLFAVDFVQARLNNLRNAAQVRDNTFGSNMRPELNPAESAVVISLSDRLFTGFDHNEGFILSPPQFDLSKRESSGQPLVFAWVEDWAPVDPLNQFSPRRGWRHTLLRIVTTPSAP
jgi:hypothetical protein